MSKAKSGVETMLEMLEARARDSGQRRAFTLLGDDGSEATITYGQLHERAVRVAVELARFTQPGDRAVLVYPTGLDFIFGFFGCVYSGVLAVPATYPKPRRPMQRLSAITADCQPAVVLTTGVSLDSLDVPVVAPDLAALRWLATDGLTETETDWRRPGTTGDDVAFLQYTSGSTSEPKGVMVSHANLLHNMQMILEGNGVNRIDGENPGRTGAFWLPAYHDMGLICGILGTIFEAGHSVIMTPTSFLQRPLRWLEMISKYRAAVSGGPNFAYELCVRKTTPAERAKLDLSSWQVAFCSAEPIRAETLDRFSEAFAPAGFCDEAYYPCYGLAEATLLAAGGKGPARPVVKRVLRTALAKNHASDAIGDSGSQVQTLVGCGHALHGQQIAIADCDSGTQCEEGNVGEIWIKGPSVARGYWQRPDETAAVFSARLEPDDEGSFLRTGDLGFVSDGQLFVTGRVKDVIIIRGLNHYPQDIEHTVEAVHPGLVFGAGSAFSIDVDGDERLVLVHELDRQYRRDDLQAIIRTVRRTVVDQHDLDLHAVVLIRQVSMPRTTSGKTQRNLCRQQYLDGELKVIEQWQAPAGESGNGRPHHSARRRQPTLPQRNGQPLDEGDIQRFADQVEAWLIDWLVERGGAADVVGRDRPFADYGLDSLTAVELSRELEDWLGVQVSAVIAWRYPTPATLSQFLARECCGGSTSTSEATGALRRRTVKHFSRILAEIEVMSDDDVQRQIYDRRNE